MPLLWALGGLSISARAKICCVWMLKKIVARPKIEGAARVARSALEAAGEDFWSQLTVLLVFANWSWLFFDQLLLIKMLT